jgi:hypothetical protein
MNEPCAGKSLPRRQDKRLLRQKGRFVGDRQLSEESSGATPLSPSYVRSLLRDPTRTDQPCLDSATRALFEIVRS